MLEDVLKVKTILKIYNIMNKLLVNIIRWILVLPVMVLAHIIAYYVYLWLSDDLKVTFFKYVEIIMAFAIASGVSIIAGTLVAPSNRKTVSVVLCTISCTLMAIGMYVIISNYYKYGLMGVLGNVASIIGAIVGTYIVHEEIVEE